MTNRIITESQQVFLPINSFIQQDTITLLLCPILQSRYLLMGHSLTLDRGLIFKPYRFH